MVFESPSGANVSLPRATCKLLCPVLSSVVCCGERRSSGSQSGLGDNESRVWKVKDAQAVGNITASGLKTYVDRKRTREADRKIKGWEPGKSRSNASLSYEFRDLHITSNQLVFMKQTNYITIYKNYTNN